MARITITTDEGIVVESVEINGDEWDLTKLIARQVLASNVLREVEKALARDRERDRERQLNRRRRHYEPTQSEIEQMYIDRGLPLPDKEDE